MIVEIEVAEPIGSDLLDPLVHVGQMLHGWLGAMEAPDDHRYLANVAFRNPTNIILVIPGRDAGGSAEIAPLHVSKGIHGCHLGASIAGGNMPTVHLEVD